MGELDGSKEIIIYCSDFDCGLSANAVTCLQNQVLKMSLPLKAALKAGRPKDTRSNSFGSSVQSYFFQAEIGVARGFQIKMQPDKNS